MATLNITNIPAPRVPFIDERTGLMAREWYRFFLNLFVLTGSGNNPITLEELQLGPPNQPDLAELLIQLNQNIAPQYEDQSGDFLAMLDTAQLMSMMARFENLEAAIQGAYLDPPSVPTDGVYVPYNNATTNVDLNNKHIVNVAHIGVGTSSTPDTLILAVGDNGSLSRVVMRGYSASTASSAIRVSKYRGTVTAPQVPQSGDSLGQFQFAGYTTTSADGSAGAYWEGVTTETWGATANGTKVLLKVTPNTTTTPVTAVTIDQDKSVTFATTASATTFIGALTGTASGNLVSGGALGTPSSGTVTNLTGTASININGTVGATTPSTGSFTTLAASSTVSGAGFTAYFASPPAIGGTAAAAGAFTTLSASDQIAGNNTASYQAIFKGWGPLESNSTAGAIVVGGSSQNSGRGEIHYWNNSSPAPALYIDNTRNAVDGKIVLRLRTSGTAIEAGSFTATGLTTAGTISPQQATTAGAPAYVKGAIYFDTTLNKLRVGGATAWETITSV